MKTPRHKIQINYKSGQSMTVTVEEFAVSRNSVNGELKVTWKSMQPATLMLGVDDIESVWQLS